MANEFFSSGVSGVDRASFDAGLRAHMQRIFNYMAGGLAITGVVSFILANTAIGIAVLNSPLRFIAMIAPLAFFMFAGDRIQTMSAATLRNLFWVFCCLMGLSLGSVFLYFTNTDITRTFFITAATFGAMSLWGYTTKRDLTGFGAFMWMGVWGLFIALLVNYVMMLFGTYSPGFLWAVSVIGVIVFTCLTAYDVQNIKQTYAESWGDEANNKLAVFGALRLYLNFINAFQFLLQLTGTVRRN